jgi:gamma-tubulin complex component 5
MICDGTNSSLWPSCVFTLGVLRHSSESLLPRNGSIPKKSTAAPFRTYQAIIWALYKYLINFKVELTQIEKWIINNDI